MIYVINLDHHGGYQGIVSKWKTLREAKLDIENEGNDIIRVGRVGYRKIPLVIVYLLALLSRAK
jgi:hypothetical protein